MPRTGRLPVPPGFHHLISRGNRRQTIFWDDRDRLAFLLRLATVVEELEWKCLAYCLMGNHFHLVVLTEHPNLSLGMQRLNGGYAQWFNRRNDLTGHLFEDRFHRVAIESDHQLLNAVRYVVLNPVRAGICRHPSRWPWSSHRATVGVDPAEPFLAADELLEHFDPIPARARRSYAVFVRDGIELAREPARRAA